ncbi:MAG: RlmI/RlmK family 23S rRNA methyltransferase, partial [Bacteroidetes bacterium CG_4_10_14_3_um_filter_31_20]
QLKKIMGNKLIAVYDKSEGTLPFKFTDKSENGFLIGDCNDEIEVLENGYKFIINFVEGQKTGFFIDQRENRQLLAMYSKDKTVANMFAYTGGFSVYALGAGAKKVESIDSSAKANELTIRNVVANNINNNHEVITVDILKYIENIAQKYNLIILDPPAFAKHNKNLNNALQAYKRLNAKAIKAIQKDGIIFTFSCSQVVSKNDFRQTIFAAAASTGRNVKILHQLSQPKDHPISVYHPEGEYLKGLVLLVE